MLRVSATQPVWPDESRRPPAWRRGPRSWVICREAEALHVKTVYASMMGAYAVDLLAEGKTNRVVGYKDGEYTDFDIDEALAMQKNINEYQFEVSKALSV